MTSKDRVMEAFNRTGPDRVPLFCGRMDNTKHWTDFCGCETEAEVRKFWELDLQKTSYSGVMDKKPGRTIWDTEDAWEKGYGSTRVSPLATATTVSEVEAHNWPTMDIFDAELLKQRNTAMEDGYAHICSLGFEPVFGTLNDLFGMEESMVLMYTEPAVIEAAVAHIEAYLLELYDAALKVCGEDIQFFWLGDDFSTQRGMMIAPEMWRKFLKPTYAKLFDLIKKHEKLVWFHSCGSFEPVRGDLVDIGIDVWETVQAHLEGNEPEKLKTEFGKHVTFFGAINCQQTLSFGTEEDVRKEVRERIRVLGADGGGYILGPDHSIQDVMPAANVFAMFDEAKKITG